MPVQGSHRVRGSDSRVTRPADLGSLCHGLPECRCHGTERGWPWSPSWGLQIDPHHAWLTTRLTQLLCGPTSHPPGPSDPRRPSLWNVGRPPWWPADDLEPSVPQGAAVLQVGTQTLSAGASELCPAGRPLAIRGLRDRLLHPRGISCGIFSEQQTCVIAGGPQTLGARALSPWARGWGF